MFGEIHHITSIVFSALPKILLHRRLMTLSTSNRRPEGAFVLMSTLST